MTRSLQNRQISRAESEMWYTSAECDHEHEACGKKNLPVVTPLFMLYRTLEMIGMKEWEFIGPKKNVSSNQFTNVYMTQNSQQMWASKFS